MFRSLARGEGISTAAAAELAGVNERTVRKWCLDHGIGLRVCGRWRVSIVALMMILSGDQDALSAYQDGDRTSPNVVEYFERFVLRREEISDVGSARACAS